MILNYLKDKEEINTLKTDLSATNTKISDVEKKIPIVPSTDTQLSTTSTNPISNKVVTEEINTLKKSVTDGKSLLAGSISDYLETASDSEFSVLNDNMNSVFQSRYDDGVTATKKGTAVAANVLTGTTFTNSSGVELAGTMPNNGACVFNNKSKQKYSIPQGYHNGNGYVDFSNAYNLGASETVYYCECAMAITSSSGTITPFPNLNYQFLTNVIIMITTTSSLKEGKAVYLDLSTAQELEATFSEGTIKISVASGSFDAITLTLNFSSSTKLFVKMITWNSNTLYGSVSSSSE